MKAATILAAASTKDQFEDLYNEVLILLDQISPLLLSKKMERPSERTMGTRKKWKKARKFCIIGFTSLSAFCVAISSTTDVSTSQSKSFSPFCDTLLLSQPCLSFSASSHFPS